MKLSVAALLLISILCGCNSKDVQLQQALELRKALISAENCSFETTITADYGKTLYTFQMHCHMDSDNNLSFTVTDPETIAGISGMISKDTASLTFDDKLLAFPILADDQLTPVSAPWIFLNALKSGYIIGSSGEEDGHCIYLEDSFSENPIHIEVHTDLQWQPYHADFFWKQQRVLSIEIRNFNIQ